MYYMIDEYIEHACQSILSNELYTPRFDFSFFLSFF